MPEEGTRAAPQQVRFEGQGRETIAGLYCARASEAGADERGPALLLVHDVLGLDAHVRASAARFAAEGFAVLAPDLYAREGAPGVARARPGASDADVRAALAALPDRRALGDLEGAARWLGARPEVDRRRLAVVGFGLGGTLAFLAGCTGAWAACVVDVCGGPLYPELSAHKPSQPLELHLNLDRPLLALFAEGDALVPPQHVAELRERLAMAGKDFTLVTVPRVGRRFFDEQSGAHDPLASAELWTRTLAFLRTNL